MSLMVLVMVGMLRVQRMVGAVGVLLIATGMLMTVVVMALVVMVVLVTVLVASMMGIIRVRTRGRGWRGSRHGWLPFFLTRHTAATTRRCSCSQHT